MPSTWFALQMSDIGKVFFTGLIFCIEEIITIACCLVRSHPTRFWNHNCCIILSCNWLQYEPWRAVKGCMVVKKSDNNKKGALVQCSALVLT